MYPLGHFTGDFILGCNCLSRGKIHVNTSHLNLSGKKKIYKSVIVTKTG